MFKKQEAMEAKKLRRREQKERMKNAYESSDKLLSPKETTEKHSGGKYNSGDKLEVVSLKRPRINSTISNLS